MSTVVLNGVRLNDANAASGWGNFGGSGPAPAAEPQLAYQKPNAVNKKVASTTSRAGVAYTHGSGTDMAAGTHKLFVFKGKVADAGDLNTIWGVSAVLGSGSGAYYDYNLSGSGANNDQFTGGYNSQGGLAEGYIIAAINPNIAQWREATTGSPALTSVLFFGIGAQFVAGGAKSENVGMDAIDVVTGLDYSGSAFSFGDAVNLDQLTDTNRWGLACRNGSIISLRGKHRLGQGSVLSGTDTSTVVFPDGYHGTSDAGFLMNTGAGQAYGLAGTYRGLGRLYGSDDTRPDMLCTGDGTGAISITGTFRGFRYLQLNAAHTALGAIFDTNVFDIGAASVTDCTVVCRSLLGEPVMGGVTFANFQNCVLTQSGTGHAIEINTPGTYYLVGLKFNGFGATGSSSAAIKNTSNGLVTLVISGGGTTPTYANVGVATTVVSNPATVTFTGIPNGLEARVRKGAVSLDYVGSVTGNQYIYAYTYTGAQVVTVTIGGIAGDGFSYERQTFKVTLSGGDVAIPLSFNLDPSYS